MRLAHPDLLLSFPAASVAALARQPEAPAWVLCAALRHETEAALAVARRPDLSAELLRQISRAEAWQLREAAAQHPHLPPELRAELLKDDDYDVRKALARREDLLPEELLALSQDPQAAVRAAVAALSLIPI